MNPDKFSRRTLAFTLVELLTVIAIIGILAALLMPVLNKSESRAKRVVCIDDLQQVGLAFHVFSNDHSGKFPMAVSTNEGGSLEYVESGFDSGLIFYTAFRHFQVLSNELVFPHLVLCPADMARVEASNYPALQNINVSYFVGVDGTFDKPGSILVGDRNLVTNSFPQPTILQIGPYSDLGWTFELHQNKGNVLFADGHVDEWNDSSLSSAAGESSANQSLFMPSVISNPNMPYGGSAGPNSSSSYSANSGSPSQMPNGQSGPNPGSSSQTENWQSSPNSRSPMQPSASSPSGSPGQPMNVSAGQRLYKWEAASQSQPPLTTSDEIITASADTDTNGAPEDTNAVSGMSATTQHLTKMSQHFFIWLYLLICLLMLLYFIKKYRQWAREREERLARRMSRRSFTDAGNSSR